MRWKRETAQEQYKRLTDWHEWFAWRPIRLSTIDQASQRLIHTRQIVSVSYTHLTLQTNREV